MDKEHRNVLEMRHVSKAFPGVIALSDVDITIRAGSVHAIMGENGAGKSTLIKVIGGFYQPIEGAQIIFDGKCLGRYSPREAIEMGIAIIHQELSPILDMTIAENIFLGQESTRLGLVEAAKLNQQATDLMRSIGVDYNPNEKMRNLTTAQMQMIEIIKAINRKASLIIMDEPTSSLMDTEIDRLFGQINVLREKGVGIIYISHKMDEIFRIADEITVMRDGHKISTGPISEYTMDRIVSEMVGRTIDTVYPQSDAIIGNEVLRIEAFSQKNKFHDISFSLRKGEILGITGLVGAGRTELVRSIFGLEPHDTGDVYVNGVKVRIRHPKDALAHGIAMLSEDRKLVGLVLCRSVIENISLPNLKILERFYLLDKKKERRECNKLKDRLGIKAGSLDNDVSSLSGGNQQKVVLAKWLMKNVDVFIMDEPTRGIDVAAKHEIYCIINEFVKEGKSVVIISSEMPEITGVSDRILVMSGGSISGEFTKDQFNNETIMRCAMANC